MTSRASSPSGSTKRADAGTARTLTRPSFTAAELAHELGALVQGDPNVVLDALAPLDAAQPGALSHASSIAWRDRIADTAASAVIVHPDLADAVPTTALVVDNPYLAYARASQLFAQAPALAEGVSPHARIANDAVLAADVRIAAGAVVGAGARIAAGTQIGANVTVGPGAKLGGACRIHAGVVLAHDVTLGDRCEIHPNAVIGADGFGFARAAGGRREAIAQLGSVRLGDDVSVGAGSTIDRGAIGDTVIGDGVKIDNQVQIGHNVHIGRDTVVCGCTGVVGGTSIGARCLLAGGVGVGGDGPVTIADDVVVSGMTHIAQSIARPGVYSAGTLQQPSRRWKRNALRFRALDALFVRVAHLERALRSGSAADDRKDRQDET